MGLEKIFDFLFSILAELNPLFIVFEYQEVVMLRGGKFRKVCTGGIHWKIPYLDDINPVSMQITTMTLTAQSLITLDEKPITVKAIVKYKINNSQTYFLSVYDATDAIGDVTQGIIKKMIIDSTWDMCREDTMDNEITKKARAEIKKFGVYIENVTLIDLQPSRTIRLINESSLG